MTELPPSGAGLQINGKELEPSVHLANSKITEVPTNQEAVDIITTTRRTLGELAAPPDSMNTISVILYYSLNGVSDGDISIATGLDVTTIREIKSVDAYKDALADLVESVLEYESENVRNIFQKASADAATSIVELAHANRGKALGFAASKDILDRAGHTPKNIIEHNHKMDGGLTINVVRASDHEDMPVIDITPKEEK